MNFVSPSLAQSEEHSDQAAMEVQVGTEAPGGEHHGGFPPFDPATWGSQLLWLAITFCALYYLMSRVALPRVGAILENRSNRIAGDLAAAGRLKDETDAAIAAYEQALAEARQDAHAIAQQARDKSKAEIDADRASIEAELQGKLDAAEARIAEVKAQALSDVDAIAKDATEAMVEVLVGGEVAKSDVSNAVEAAMAERS